ncbi:MULTISPECIES: hypothetical protein [unclassified Novosphingobium]|uniref:hypothetical protein n=1 Tax=unclassified Novosphingobium TaxID=2644732 RepID=UPI0025F06E57|nr:MULTISPECIES: hypothetical protein [unclassified Novosphingobium]HQV03628.1 hypothetical protein [Novosphingobium sp.]
MPLLTALALVQAATEELPPLGSAGPPVAAEAPADACSGATYAAFDFWLGDWTVYAKQDGTLIGKSRVEKINNGCAVRETWLPQQGKAGGNLNAPDLITGRWHQYWIDAHGNRVDLEGGLYQGAMLLAGPWRRVNGSTQDALLRITYTRLDPDSVRQLAEFSEDEGLTWQVSFDYLYLRARRGD